MTTLRYLPLALLASPASAHSHPPVNPTLFNPDPAFFSIVLIAGWFAACGWALRHSDRTGAVLIPALIFFGPFIGIPLLLVIGGLTGVH